MVCTEFAMGAQDRAIRAEENLRHFALTGKLLDKRLRKSQVIALRFADDTEFVLLAEKAANENMKPDDIKKAIVNWRARSSQNLAIEYFYFLFLKAISLSALCNIHKDNISQTTLRQKPATTSLG